MQQIIKEEVGNLKQEGMLDYFKKEKAPVDFRSDDYFTREKLQAELDNEQKKRLDLAMQTTQQFLNQELSDAQRFEGFNKLRRMLGSVLDPHTDLDRVIKNILRESKEELSLFAGLETENNFIKKYNLTELEDGSNFEELLATWKTSLTSGGDSQWKKRHGIRQAFVMPDSAKGTWNWVVFEYTKNDEEDDIAQGTASSHEEAIIAADRALVTGR